MSPVMMIAVLVLLLQEVYSLHRRLTGCFLTCIRLKAVIPCRDMLMAYTNSSFAGDAVLVHK